MKLGRREAEFMDRLADEDFTAEEQQDLIRDFAEIEYLTTGTYNNWTSTRTT